jgi:dTDP-4-dehydrorhamnose 3,5-epimerase
MKVESTALPDVLLVEPDRFGDARGFFQEAWHQGRYAEAGIGGPFVQDNISLSVRGVLRGLHLQNPNAQGKLISVLQGEVFDAAVDLRVGSPHFGRWAGAMLSMENRRQMWVPEGFAHGFCVLSETALFAYKCTDFYAPESEITVLWNDPGIGIDWPLSDPVVSGKDAAAEPLSLLDPARLPLYTGPK